MTPESSKGTVLITLAREAIAENLGKGRVRARDHEWLHEMAATFVTLEKRGDLRGCIGSLEPTRSLFDDVVANARSAAFHDPRFPPVRVEELPALSIEVSVLSPIEPFPVSSEEDLLERLEPFHHGLVLRLGPRRATFLPSVWEQLPRPHEFVRHLKMKAGIPAHHWDDQMQVFTYTVEKYGE